VKDLIPQGDFVALDPRNITRDSCEKWGYHVADFRGSDVQVADYRDDQGQLVAQKVRFRNKDFTILGNARDMGLYGKHLWREKGKKIVITEGEIDAISISQVQDHKWPVVSIPNGASGAKKSIQADLQYLESFEEVVLCFDNDEPGIEAARECALLFTPGKCKIATLPLKDANEMLVAGRVKELIDALWSAKTYRPDGIVAGVDLWDQVALDPQTENYPTPWPELNKTIGGLRKGEITTLTAGSGIGKSQLCREIACDLVVHQNQKVGYVALEESTKRTALGLMGVYLDRPIHQSKEGVAEADLRKAFDATVGSGRVFLYDHFGSLDAANLLARIRYLIRGCECDWIIFDHLSMAVSGIEDGDERRIIDNLMTQLRSLVQETGVGMVLVSHLKRREGQSHEEGGATSLAQLRGSGSIGQISDTVIGVERNQQDEAKKHISTLRVLKCRWNGQTGLAGELAYDPQTGRLRPNGLFAPVGADSQQPKGHF
jgi:twinkle protein